MALTSKIRVGVLRGGPSREHEISIKSGNHVMRNMPEKYSAIDIYIDKSGIWHLGGISMTPAMAMKRVDIFFNALHGEYGEDGALQLILDAFGVPYTGSGRLASCFAMHKGHAKNLLKRHGIKTPYHKILKKSDKKLPTVRELWMTVPNPSIVKPVGLGSSIGVSLAGTFTGLSEALEKAFSYSDAILVEDYISGHQATCGVIDDFRNEPVYALLPVEQVLPDSSQFLAYDSKSGGKPKTFHPGRFSVMEKETIQNVARQVHQALGLKHYSRSDFIVSPKRGVYFLEVNSSPGLYADAPFTESLGAIGLSFSGFLDHVITLALRKNGR